MKAELRVRMYDPTRGLPNPVRMKCGMAMNDVTEQKIKVDGMLEELKAIAAAQARGSQTLTSIPRLTIWRSSRKTDPAPAMFEPKIYLVLQGAKRLTVGSKTFDYFAGGYSVSSVSLPFNVQVLEASPERPYLGLDLKLDAGIIASLLLEMPEVREPASPAFALLKTSDGMIEPLQRMMRLLCTTEDIPVLAPLMERELYYRILRGPMGSAMRQVVQSQTRFSQVRKAVDWICSNADSPLRIDQLAASVGMSATSFHRHFKAVTALSPLAYQKQIRLLSARRLLISGGNDVTRVAFAVGYESSSQFSREYARMFGLPPTRDTARLRQSISNPDR